MVGWEEFQLLLKPSFTSVLGAFHSFEGVPIVLFKTVGLFFPTSLEYIDKGGNAVFAGLFSIKYGIVEKELHIGMRIDFLFTPDQKTESSTIHIVNEE